MLPVIPEQEPLVEKRSKLWLLPLFGIIALVIGGFIAYGTIVMDDKNIQTTKVSATPTPNIPVVTAFFISPPPSSPTTSPNN